jgi:hypothetical protein
LAGLFVPSPKYYSHSNLSIVLSVNGDALFGYTPCFVLAVVWKIFVLGQTKLQSAATIAQSGVPVIIVKCESTSAEQALRGGGGGDAAAGVIDVGTTLSVRQQ